MMNSAPGWEDQFGSAITPDFSDVTSPGAISPYGGGSTGGGLDWKGMIPGMGSIAGGIASLFGGGGDDEDDAAEQQLARIPGMFKPYTEAGAAAIPTLQSQYGKLLSDPGALMASLGEGFQASPGYAYNVRQATDAANRASAAGGMVGSPAEQQALSKNVMGMANQDYYNYLNHAINMYGQGLSGMGGMARMGMQGQEDVATGAESEAKLEEAKAQQQQQQQGSGIGSILGGIAAIAPLL